MAEALVLLACKAAGKPSTVLVQEWPRQTKPKKGQFMNFPQGIPEQKFNVNRACFPKEKTPEFTKMGEIHELFVLALSLVWFAGATPDWFLFASGPWRCLQILSWI